MTPTRTKPALKTKGEQNPKLKRLGVLYRISDILATTQRSETVLRKILKEAVKATRATSGSIVMIDRPAGVLHIRIADNIDSRRTNRLKLKIGEGVTGWVAKTGKPLLVGDVRHSPHYIKLKAEIKSELAVPLAIGGEIVGVINVDCNRLHAFDEGDRELLTAIAAQSAKVMQAAQLYEENRLKAERLDTVFKVAGTLVTEPTLENVLRRIADEVRRLMDVRVCSIMLLDDARENLEIKAVSGKVVSAYADRQRIPLEGSVIGEAISSRRPVFVPDVRKEKRYKLSQLASESGLCSLLSIPMIFLGHAIGVFNIYSAEPCEFSDDDVALMRTFAGHAAVAIVNAQRYARIFETEELLRESEKFQLLGLLSAEIAHEVRNPLTSLRLLAHTMQNDESASDQMRFDLEIMDRKLNHINRIVDQVLDFSRARQGEPRELDLHRILDDVSMLVGHKAARMKLEVHTTNARTLPKLKADPGQIEQAILNLAINGLEAMRDQGTLLTISTKLVRRRGKDWVRVRIQDEGCGIPEEEISSIFEPFFSRSDGGTGLGLSVTRRIVREHGGELKVKSALNEGTTFDILLPSAGPGETTETDDR